MLEHMPDELREAFVLFELEELSPPEVARMLEVPVRTVASRVRRAREQLRTARSRRATQSEKLYGRQFTRFVSSTMSS